MLLENPSTYVAFADAAMSEIAFLREVARRTGCGLLLDVNNVYVQSVNHGFDAGAFIDEFPVEHVGEVHLGGHAVDSDADDSALLIDDHGREVADAVWALYARALSGPKPTLIEWDNDVPAWEVLFARRNARTGSLPNAAPIARRRRMPSAFPKNRSHSGHHANSAYHAADAVPLPLQAIASAADRAADAVLALHPSLGVVRSSYPIVSIYELNAESGDVPHARLAGSEDALVARSGLKVEIRRLPEGGAPFILALKDGKTIGEAAILALHESSAFDLKANLAGLMAGGAIVAVGAVASG